MRRRSLARASPTTQTGVCPCVRVHVRVCVRLYVVYCVLLVCERVPFKLVCNLNLLLIHEPTSPTHTHTHTHTHTLAHGTHVGSRAQRPRALCCPWLSTLRLPAATSHRPTCNAKAIHPCTRSRARTHTHTRTHPPPTHPYTHIPVQGGVGGAGRLVSTLAP